MAQMMKRLICFITGHAWLNFGGHLQKAMGLAHLHTRAGNLDLCERCGEVWDDTWPWHDTNTEEFRSYHGVRILVMMEHADKIGLKVRPFRKLPPLTLPHP